MKFAEHSVRFTLSNGETIIDVQWQDDRGDPFVVVLTSLGRILRQPSSGGPQDDLQNVGDQIDLAKPTKIYCSDGYIAIVNERGTNGVVIKSRDNKWMMLLCREDHHSEHCPYPIAFIKSGDEQHLLQATQWNRLDITDLETGRFLTDRVVEHEPRTNYLDYFLGRLHVAPDNRHFVSSGWAWSPVDFLYVWEVESFHKAYEPSGQYLEQPEDFEGSGYVFDRPSCFIDNKHFAWGFNPSEELIENAEIHVESEVAISDVAMGKVVERIPFDHFAFEQSGYREVCGTLAFDGKSQSFIAFSDKHDLVVTDRKGTEIGRRAIRPRAFSTSALSALCINGPNVDVTILQFSKAS